jgi:hypothetical protein
VKSDPGVGRRWPLNAARAEARVATGCPSSVCSDTVSAAASNVTRQCGRVNGENSMCSSTVFNVMVWSNVTPGGHPFIDQIGPPTDRSTVKPQHIPQLLPTSRLDGGGNQIVHHARLTPFPALSTRRRQHTRTAAHAGDASHGGPPARHSDPPVDSPSGQSLWVRRFPPAWSTALLSRQIVRRYVPGCAKYPEPAAAKSKRAELQSPTEAHWRLENRQVPGRRRTPPGPIAGGSSGIGPHCSRSSP